MALGDPADGIPSADAILAARCRCHHGRQRLRVASIATHAGVGDLEALPRAGGNADLVPRGRGHAAQQGGVEVAHLGLGGPDELGDGAQRNRPVHGDHVVVHRIQLGRLEAVGLGGLRDRQRGEKAGDVVTGLGMEVSILHQGPVRIGPLAGHGAGDAALAGVVRRQGEVPVAEHLVEVAQVLGRRARRLVGVAALVDVLVDAQPVALAGGADELPGADGAGVGDRPVVEPALDERQIGQPGRQPLLF